MADDIAYNNHDIDDGLRAGLFDIADLRDLPLVGPVFAEVMQRYPNLDSARLIHESIRRLIDRMANDLIDETRRRLSESMAQSTEAVRRLGMPVVAMSAGMRDHDRALKGFLFERMYRHERVNRMTATARRTVQDLFGRYMADLDLLPADWRRYCDAADQSGSARLVADYIAGMTDRYAFNEHARLFGPQTQP